MDGVKIKMMALSIGPDFKFEPKKEYIVSAELAERYVSAGFAVYIDAPKTEVTKDAGNDGTTERGRSGAKRGKRQGVPANS